MIGYIETGTLVQREDGTLIITKSRWTVSAIPSGNQWKFQYGNETFYVNDADFIPIVDGD